METKLTQSTLLSVSSRLSIYSNYMVESIHDFIHDDIDYVISENRINDSILILDYKYAIDSLNKLDIEYSKVHGMSKSALDIHNMVLSNIDMPTTWDEITDTFFGNITLETFIHGLGIIYDKKYDTNSIVFLKELIVETNSTFNILSNSQLDLVLYTILEFIDMYIECNKVLDDSYEYVFLGWITDTKAVFYKGK